jgi:hypothetical protein
MYVEAGSVPSLPALSRRVHRAAWEALSRIGLRARTGVLCDEAFKFAALKQRASAQANWYQRSFADLRIKEAKADAQQFCRSKPIEQETVFGACRDGHYF